MSKIPAAIGPYSTYREAGDLIFVSGQLPVNGMTGEIEATDIKGQTKQVMENIQLILNEVGANFDQIVKTTCFLTDFSGFVSFNEVYGEYFTGECPARSAFQVSALPKGALVEIEFIIKK
ncbi:Rid family detoxifying hydrolase [Vagococcus xieshaowenii]|uniref:RidA family protein n=1 Tax=Vagococcus xieshaowenii TaxID=2562451 RepID=A0AAJ5EF95_9ENTE|nr:Rid family detoxifying hydrolase [Vagococcus xieshaowenii]QCA29412.1 RidA family protein [Vagococcus xieshaowenii]TFZ41533.1 RidA family protein [Vagococcus xieshaowenii]